MREMKDSGIEWIGEIPEDWELVQLKRFADVHNGKEISVELDKTDVNAFPVYGSGGVFKFTDQYMYDGTAVMFGRKGTLGKPLFVQDKFWVVDTMYFLTYTTELIPKYNYYQLIAFDWEPHITHTALPSVVASEIVACNFPFPKKIKEQEEIISFLDKKCAEIDEVISKTEATIEEYKKLKQSVITQAVTKGIRPNRKMKDSGIEWIGEIPEEWDTQKIKYVTRFVQEKYSEIDGDINYIGLENIVSWNGQYIPTDSEYDKEQSLICEENDILFGKLRPYLAKVYISTKKQCCSGEFAVVRVDSRYSVKYIWYQLISHGFIFMIDRSTYGTKMPRANADFIKNNFLSLPPIKEQFEIVDYLDSNCIEIDNLVASKQKLIEELQTYKKSVIYEYVTGKKEVIC